MDDKQAERSKLVQKQKQQQQELEKKVKKLKGAMKEAAQKELEELSSKHEAELADLNKSQGVAKSGGAAAKAPEAAASAPSGKSFREKNFAGLSKKELEKECEDRGLGKKGSKEDLVTRLTIFHQEIASKVARGAMEPAAEEKAKKPGSGKASKKAAKEESEEDEDEDEDGGDDDDDESESDEEDDADDVSPEEAEKQHKREKLVQKAMKHLLKEDAPDGFPLGELTERLASIKVTGFNPETCGYKTLEKFVKGQPEKVLNYDKKTQFISPGSRRD